MLVGLHVPTNLYIASLTLTLRKYMYSILCERAERASLENFGIICILKLLFLSLFCWYIRYFVGTNDDACRLTCTDKFPNVPTKLRKGIIGGAVAPPCPPSGYANVGNYTIKLDQHAFCVLYHRYQALELLSTC